MGLDIRVITTTNVSGTQHSRDPEAAAAMAQAGEALLSAALMKRLAEHDVRVDEVVTVRPSNLPDAEPVEALAAINARIAENVANAIKFEISPVLVGGNCSHIIGIIGGIQAAQGATTRLGLLWLDAHGDFNTPRTSLSGMYGGMPVAVAAGLCLPEWREGGGQQVPLPTNRIVMVDVRNLDEAEEALIKATDVEIARFGEQFAVEPVIAAIDRLAERWIRFTSTSTPIFSTHRCSRITRRWNQTARVWRLCWQCCGTHLRQARCRPLPLSRSIPARAGRDLAGERDGDAGRWAAGLGRNALLRA